MTNVRKVCASEADRAVGLLDYDQNLTVDATNVDAKRLKKRLLALYRNMGLVIVVYDDRELYVERPKPKGLK